MKKALILLSTYNGEKYLNEQLDSLLNQQNISTTILIRDDGSTDETLNIINKYKNDYNHKIFFIAEKNIGWKKSFFQLLEIADKEYDNFDYYAFSDQDDIWETNKLYQGIKLLANNNDTPTLYCSNLYYYKNNNNLGKIIKHPPIITPKSALVRNYATGCTIVFNKLFLKLLNKQLPQIDIAHDYWCYLVANTCGRVIYDMNSYILYRQHDNNQIGYKPGWKEKWKRRLSQFKRSLAEHARENNAKELERIFYVDMHTEGKEAVHKMAHYRDSWTARFNLLKDNDYTTGVKSSDRWIRLRILFNYL